MTHTSAQHRDSGSGHLRTNHPEPGYLGEVTGLRPARLCRVDQQRGEALDPPVEGHVINIDTAFGEEFFEIPV